MERIHALMGTPTMIIKSKKEKIKEKPKKEADGNKIDTDEEKDDEDEDDEKDKCSIFPKFGLELLKENKDNEIFKYITIFKRYETHCILAQLFPCSDNNLYYNDIKEIKRKKYCQKKKEKILCINY
jgi:hypothetical protein